MCQLTTVCWTHTSTFNTAEDTGGLYLIKEDLINRLRLNSNPTDSILLKHKHLSDKRSSTHTSTLAASGPVKQRQATGVKLTAGDSVREKPDG